MTANDGKKLRRYVCDSEGVPHYFISWRGDPMPKPPTCIWCNKEMEPVADTA